MTFFVFSSPQQHSHWWALPLRQQQGGHTCDSGDSWRLSPAMLYVTNMFSSPHRLHNAYWLVYGPRVEPHLTPLTEGGSIENSRKRVRMSWGEVRLGISLWEYQTVKPSSQRCWLPPANKEAKQTSGTVLAGGKDATDIWWLHIAKVKCGGEYEHLSCSLCIDSKSNTGNSYQSAFPARSDSIVFRQQPPRWAKPPRPWSGGV